MYLVENTRMSKYITINKSDANRFIGLVNFFECGIENFNFKIIKDEKKTKEILDTLFSSKNRGGKYDTSMLSVTNVVSNLFPSNLFKEQYLLRWQNNVHEGELALTNAQSKISLKNGTYIHKILELWVTDTESRANEHRHREYAKRLQKFYARQNDKGRKINKGKPHYLNDFLNKYVSTEIEKYIYQAKTDEEIIKLGCDEKTLANCEHLARTCLIEFIKNELLAVDCIFSEIFLKTKGYIQGSIDLVGMQDNKLIIIDFKTTSSVYKEDDEKLGYKVPTKKGKWGSLSDSYVRQLCVYYHLLKEHDLIPLHMLKDVSFKICQIHLVRNEYRVFDLEQASVLSWQKQINRVLKWYWETRQLPYNERIICDENEENKFDILANL